MKRVRQDGEEARLIATWGINLTDEFEMAVFTWYALREDSRLEEPSSQDRLPPVAFSLERLKQLRKELAGLIETMERGRGRASRPN